MQKRGAFFVLAAATLWGTTGTSQALAPEGATPLVIGTLRLALGGLVLLGYALLRGSLRQNLRLPFWQLMAAAVCIAAYQLLFFAGVNRTGVAVGTIVGIGSSPIIGGILGYFFRGERPAKSWYLATLLAIGGAALLASTGETMQVDPLGLLLAIGAGGAYAAFTLFSKGLLEKAPSDTVLALTFLAGMLLLLPLLVGANLAWVIQPRGVLVTLHLGVITVGVAYTLFGQGLRLVPVSTAVTLTLAEPMTAGILGLVILGETLTITGGLGILLIFSGLGVLSAAPPSSAPVSK
ncbi:MAG TPA: DMT family transporter [Anaerolineaceae bacterium]